MRAVFLGDVGRLTSVAAACGIIPELLHSGDVTASRLPIAAVLAGFALILGVNTAMDGHAH